MLRKNNPWRSLCHHCPDRPPDPAAVDSPSATWGFKVGLDVSIFQVTSKRDGAVGKTAKHSSNGTRSLGGNGSWHGPGGANDGCEVSAVTTHSFWSLNSQIPCKKRRKEKTQNFNPPFAKEDPGMPTCLKFPGYFSGLCKKKNTAFEKIWGMWLTRHRGKIVATI